MNILAIETSCDETAASVVKDGRIVLSNVVSSQIDIHAAYGGVVPEVAARVHVQSIIPVVEEALSEANLDWGSIDAIAVTEGPGLVGSLIVGTETARTLAILKGKPLISVNHLEGHVYANWVGAISNFQFPISNQCHPELDSGSRNKDIDSGSESGMTRRNKRHSEATKNLTPQFPIIALLVSGGHTMLIHMEDHYKFKIIGQTRDDAAGEAFDKVAALLGLPYPGGPNISKLASSCHSREGGKPEEKYKFPVVDLTPEPKRGADSFLEYPEPSLDFSLSGLKTAVLNEVKKKKRLSEKEKSDIAASFQKSLIDTLAQNSQRAIEKYKPKSFILSGGVAANEQLRTKLEKMCKKLDIEFYMPNLAYCTDNATMVGVAAYYKQKVFGFVNPKTLTPNPNLKLF